MSAALPDLGLRLGAQPAPGTNLRYAVLGQGVRVTIEAFDLTSGAAVLGANPSLTIFPPATEAVPTPAPIMVATDLLTQITTSTWRFDIDAATAGGWIVYAAATSPRDAAAQIAFVVAAVAGDVPNPAAPMVVTQDLWPILTENGGVLTATRVPALPVATSPAGLLLIGAQGGQTVQVPSSVIRPLRSFAFFLPGSAPVGIAPAVVVVADVAMALPADLAGSQARIEGDVPTVEAEWGLWVGGTMAGTITFAAGERTGVFAVDPTPWPQGAALFLYPPLVGGTGTDASFTLQAGVI